MKKNKILKSGFSEKLKLLLIPIGLLIGSFAMHAWAGDWSYTLSFYCIPGEIFGDNDEYHDMAYRCVSVGANDGTGTWREAQMSATGIYYKGYEIYSATLTGWAHENAQGGAYNIYFKLRHADTWETVYGEHGWGDWREMSYINGYIRTKDGWDIYKYDHTISAGSTIIWDMAGNESMWGASYLYKDINGGSGSNDAMTNIAGTHQYYITYDNAVNYVASFQFRSNTDNWNDYSHTTNIERNVSGVTLYTNLNNSTGSPAKLNWQVSENAKKATGGVKIYFDNTAANWSAIWLKYGTTWYNRKSTSAASKVSGTDNLYVIEMPTDIYYAKYYLADNFGWVNYSDIEEAGNSDNLMSNRIASQESDLTSDITFIPSTGNSSTPKVWTTTTMSGHTHKVTVGSHNHGTITLSYTDENNVSQTPTVTTNVARTCYVSASASADNGYDYTSMTLGSNSYTPNTSIIITKDTTFAATFTAHTYSITLNKGDQGEANQSATVDFDATSLKSVAHVVAKTGYMLEGYYDGSTKVLNADGSFAATNVMGYITGGKWSKYDSNATLTAKFALRWTVTGNTSALGNWAQPGSLELGNITTSDGVTTGYIEVSLAAHTAYEIKMYDKAAGATKLVGYASDPFQINYSNSGDSYALNTYPGYNFKFLSAGAGTYRITRDMTNNKVIITYPTAYKVTYYSNDADDDDVPVDDVYYGSGETVTVKGNTGSLSKTGYDALAYWNTKNDGSGSNYAIGSDEFTISDNTSLFAKWTQTVELDANGGESDGSTTATWNAAGPFTISAPERTGHEIEGYYAEAGCTNKVLTNAGAIAATSVVDGSSVTFISGGKWAHAAATTLYTKWTPKVYTVTLNTNDGTINAGDITSYTYGVGATLPTNVTKSGYDFAGWYDNEELIGDAVTAITSSDIENKAYWAKWTEHTYTSGVLNKTTGSTAGAYSVTFHDNKIVVNTKPGKDGYHVDGYYLGYDPANGDYSNRVANQDGSLYTIDVSGYVESQTWVYAGIPELYAKWAPNSYKVTLDANIPSGTTGTDGTEELSATMGTTFATSDMVLPTATGYEFTGYFDSEDVKVIDTDKSKPSRTYVNVDGLWVYPDNVTLYAHWTPVALSFVGGEGESGKVWGTAANWSPACVPTIEHDVTINAETTISGSAVAKSVSIGDGGKVTIQPTGVLEVAGKVTNTDDRKLIINTNSSNQGALIYDITTAAPSATINMTMDYTGGDNFQYIASPVGGARVSSMFSGKGIYTYAWIEGKGWERRGYYDDFMGNEVIVINGQGSCIFSGLLYPSTGGSLAYTATPEDASAQGVNMIPNTLTAPIKIAAMLFSGSSDNGVHIWQNGAWRDYATATSAAADAVIPALQGYAVLASGSGSVSFEYDAAVRNASSHNAPLGAPKRVAEGTPEYMTISVMTGDRKVDLQLSEHAQFTTAIDKGWETIYMEGDGRFGQLYALADEKMSILATPDLEGTVLGFVPGETLNYTLTFEGDGKGYYLNDIEEQQSTLIEEGNTYTFSSGNNNAARFIISRTPINKIATGVDAVSDGVKARKQMSDGVLYIIRDGRMYNAEGMLVK